MSQVASTAIRILNCLKWEAWRTPCEASIGKVNTAVKRPGKKAELSTTTNGSTAKTPKKYQTEEEDYEHEQKDMKGHTSSPLEVKSIESSLKGRLNRVEKGCQAVRREGRIIHHRESLYPLTALILVAILLLVH